jgi:hypothetical protein
MPSTWDEGVLTVDDVHSVVQTLGECLADAADLYTRLGIEQGLEMAREAWRAHEVEHGRWRDYREEHDLAALVTELRDHQRQAIRSAVQCLVEHAGGEVLRSVQKCRCPGSRWLHDAMTNRSEPPE